MNEKIVGSTKADLSVDPKADAVENGQHALSEHLLRLRYTVLASKSAHASSAFLASKSLKTFDILKILDAIHSNGEKED